MNIPTDPIECAAELGRIQGEWRNTHWRLRDMEYAVAEFQRDIEYARIPDHVQKAVERFLKAVESIGSDS